MAAGGAAAAQREVDDGPELNSIRDVLIGIRQDHAVLTSTVRDLRTQQRNFFRLDQRFPQ